MIVIYTGSLVRHTRVSNIIIIVFSLMLIVVALIVPFFRITGRDTLVIALARFLSNKQLVVLLIRTIDGALIATAKDVAVVIGHAFHCAYLTAVDLHLGLAEDVSLTLPVQLVHEFLVHELPAVAAPAVLASAATEDVTHDKAVEHLDVGLACLEDAGAVVHDAVGIVRSGFGKLEGAATDGAYLAATIETAAHGAAIHIDIGVVNVAVHHIAATEDVAGKLQVIGFRIVQLRHIVVYGFCVGAGVLGAVAHIAVVHRDVGRAIDRAALATAIDVALDGGNTVTEVCAPLLTDNHIGLGQKVANKVGVDFSGMIAYMTLVAAAIDVTAHAALDVGIGAGREDFGLKDVVQTTGTACSIDVFRDFTAE